MFKEKLIEERKKHEDTQDSLAFKLNVSRSLVAKWEQGRSFPSLDDINKICEIYSIEFDYLLSKNELKERYGIVEKKNKRKNIIITLIVMSISFAVVIFSIIGFVISISTTKPKYTDTITDKITGNYEFSLPFPNNEMTKIGDTYYFDKSISFNAMKDELEKAGYMVEIGLNSFNKEYLVIYMFYDDRFAPMFMIYDPLESTEESSRLGVKELTTFTNSFLYYSLPVYSVDSDKTLELGAKYNKKGYIIALDMSFDELVNFYEKSVSGIIYLDNDNKEIYIRARNKELGETLNCILKLKFIESEYGNYIDISKVNSYD